MQTGYPARLMIFLFLLVAMYPGLATAEDSVASTDKLNELRRQIQELKGAIRADRKQEADLDRALRVAEEDIGRISLEVHRIDAELREQQRRRASLLTDHKERKDMLAKLRRTISRQARTGFALGQQQQIKMLLNQEDPAIISRMLAYHGYISRAQSRNARALRNQLGELRAIEQSIEQQSLRLGKLRGQRAEEIHELETVQLQRQKTLESLKKEIQDKDQLLERYVRDEQRLEDLLASLQDNLADIPNSAGRPLSIRSMKGKLPWPVSGPLMARYGQRRAGADLRWRGVIIGATDGAEVRSISHGRVAFADWLRGVGLLLIIDHGDGYMSLYGYNQSLYKEVGDWVEANEVIALVGGSGGQSRSGLYFELRKEGRPVNPASWCQGPVPQARARGVSIRLAHAGQGF